MSNRRSWITRRTTRRIARRLTATGLCAIGLFALAGTGPAAAQGKKTPLLIGYQDISFPEITAASKLFENTPYDLQWVVLAGPAGQLSGLYSKAIDVGHMGDTSLIIEQGRAQKEWTPETVPLQIVAGWRTPDAKYPPIVTAVRKSANIKSLADLRGKRWTYNFGGFNYLQYVLTYLKAGLKPSDFEPIQLADQAATSATFSAGRADVFSGSVAFVAETLEKGEASVLINSDELDIPALSVFTARGDVIRDPAKAAALGDFLGRYRQFWGWYASHLDVVEKVYIEKVKQTPNKARLSTQYNNSVFVRLDDSVVRREQRIADTLFEAGAIPRKIAVAVEFSRVFNDITAPAGH